ncbi:MAG: 50S ribosomal protein L28 [Dehalococcoidia bacterium]
MSGLCDLCGKHTSFGRNIRHKHSGRWNRKAPRTSRTFKPNVHRRKFVIDGKTVHLDVCTQCLKTMLKRMVA